jgi:hypothetical protein
MKSKLILSALAFFIFSSIFAQGVKFGFKGGASINKLSGKSFNEQFTFGYHVGAFVTIKVSKKVGIQPEVIFNQVNQDTASNYNALLQFNNIDKIKLSYLCMPILLNYYFNKYLALQVGPQFSILVSQNLVQSGKDAFKKGEIAAAGGLQLNILKFRAYARYLIGLNNVNDINTSDSWKNQSIQLGVGFSLK